MTLHNAKGWASVLVLLMMVLSLTMPSGVAPPGLPSLTVEIGDVDEVESDPVEFTHVSITATVTLENFLAGASVTVNATTDNYWLVTVSPTTFTVDQGTGSLEERINLDIRVPPRASAERSVELKVFANAKNQLSLEYEDEDIATLTVKHYYGLRSSTNGTATLEQGKNTTVRMRITNTGNGLDNLTIAWTNEAIISAKGITLTCTHKMHEIGPDRIANIVIRVTAASDAEVGTAQADLKITSDGDATKSVNYHITINVQKAKDDNGGNGNGDDTDGDDDGFIPGLGGAAGIVVLVALGAVMASRRLRKWPSP